LIIGTTSKAATLKLEPIEMMAAEADLNMSKDSQIRKKGLFGRLQLRKKGETKNAMNSKSGPVVDRNVETPTSLHDADSPTPLDNIKFPSGASNMDPSHTLKAVRFPANDALKKIPASSRRELQKPPPAREAAYGGPPRYDWIDIVSSHSFHCNCSTTGEFVCSGIDVPWSRLPTSQ
jgi:hypothetical protein